MHVHIARTHTNPRQVGGTSDRAAVDVHHSMHWDDIVPYSI